MTDSTPRAGRREWLGVAALMLPCMLVVMDLSVLFLAVPSLKADLRPSDTELLWITDVYGFLIAGALIVMGTLGDRIGRRRVLVWGSAAFGAASVLAACSSSPELLIVARGLQGIAGATLIPSTMALLFAMFPHEGDRMKAIGLISLGFTGGAALGPILGGVLLDVASWHAVFLINVPAMLAVIAVVPRVVPEFANPDGPRVDLGSAALLVVSVLSTTYAIKAFAHHNGGAVADALIVGGPIVGALFLRRQGRIATPLLDLNLFRRRAFTVGLLSQSFTTFVMFGTFFFFNQYLQVTLGLSPLHAALWSLPGLVGMSAGTMAIVPRLAQTYRPVTLMTGGALIMVAGLAALSRVQATTAPVVVSLVVLVFQVGVAPLVTLGMNIILSAAPPEATGAASGTAQTCNELGGALGIALLGSLGTAQGSILSGLSLVALVGAGLMLVIAALLWTQLGERKSAPIAQPVPA
ncbi:MAG: transporter, family, multidrug resistance protein [Solirubrobacteraceae bacterium]|jgi:DHA2 family multidrug resistance protein-like MFS transporter|nr:transporter, family, multidrug resistance protein [Solirubrobacteraceae bacterium]